MEKRCRQSRPQAAGQRPVVVGRGQLGLHCRPAPAGGVPPVSNFGHASTLAAQSLGPGDRRASVSPAHRPAKRCFAAALKPDIAKPLDMIGQAKT